MSSLKIIHKGREEGHEALHTLETLLEIWNFEKNKIKGSLSTELDCPAIRLFKTSQLPQMKC